MLNSLGRSLVLRAQHAESDGRRRAVLAELAAVLAGGEVGEPFARAAEKTGANEGEEIAALDEAVSVLTDAIADRSATAANRSLSVSNLGSALWIRYQLTGKARDLDRAARELCRATVEAPLPGRIHAVALSYLGRVLMDVWRRRHDDRTRAEAEEALRASVAVEVAPADFRAFVARLLGDFIVETGRPAEAVEAYATAVGLLEAIAWRGLSRPDQERLLAEFEDVAVDAAACALTAGRPRLAVELLEQGRGVLLTQVIDGRSGYDRLRAAAPEPAERLRAVQDELGARSAEGGDQPDADRVHALVREQDRLLAEIRELPGFADFLRPPAFERLSAGAGGGPLVIVNVSRLRCDAITVAPDDVRVTALPGLDHAEVGRRADELLRFVAGRDGDRRRPEAELGEILGWLWDVIAAPILADLDVAGPDTRLWWCPTGRLAILPLHAAGRHGAGGRDTVLDRVVSSYTPTARALLHARPPRAAASTGTRALVVAMPHTDGYADLPGAEEELAEVTARYPDATLAVGPAATRAAVLAAVAGCDLAHFACHAAHDLNAPSASRLLLHDRPLTVRDLVAHRAGQAELAYLSACETFSGSRRLPDEAISLAGTVQLAGFRQVIGTLWAVSDRYAPRVARAVYAGIAEAGDLTGTAAALHDAVRSLRDRRPAAPSLWAPYVHIGP
ncbi:CHAT domain-containing protein [Actinoplanes sp. NPDC051470]|uniref:CHAT domain-containing protein n=1 Tax=Actinoplanes sp. NPDC051470 TaxID=3157224 RepID=UPI0034120A11